MATTGGSIVDCADFLSYSVLLGVTWEVACWIVLRYRLALATGGVGIVLCSGWVNLGPCWSPRRKKPHIGLRFSSCCLVFATGSYISLRGRDLCG